MRRTIGALKASFTALMQQHLCQGSACVCSTLAAAVGPIKAAVVRCDACLHAFLVYHFEHEGQHTKVQGMERQLCTMMWEFRSEVADLLAESAQVLMMMRHTPEALSTLAAAYNE
jgi:hypothetical protein